MDGRCPSIRNIIRIKVEVKVVFDDFEWYAAVYRNTRKIIIIAAI